MYPPPYQTNGPEAANEMRQPPLPQWGVNPVKMPTTTMKTTTTLTMRMFRELFPMRIVTSDRIDRPIRDVALWSLCNKANCEPSQHQLLPRPRRHVEANIDATMASPRLFHPTKCVDRTHRPNHQTVWLGTVNSPTYSTVNSSRTTTRKRWWW